MSETRRNLVEGGTPQVTVLIPVYNRADLLPTAVASVREQTEKRWRCIVIDDGSTDDTLAVARDLAQADERLEVLALTDNRGLGNALQAGLEQVRTPYFVILDSDDWFSPDAIRLCLAKMEQEGEDVSLVCADGVYWIQTEDGDLRRDRVQKGRAFVDKYDFFRYGPNLVPRFLRTEDVRAVGGFENDPAGHGRYLEDKLLLLKLIAHSRFAYIDAELYNIRQHGHNMTHPSDRRRFQAIKRQMYERMMREWGDEYEIEWEEHPEGWLDVKTLHPKA
ncbi:glycosyltransferase involved in cell wall biosynthesis [Alicyclobacillus sacchari]|uniref:Glycosyltransferase involved in cell wall biosynthesis n=1 Tax=Alicyclobacillus sacchari TaxID=392010 RepID=A0A4R8LU54_9BACL|nr:glycosyltransferase family 2 protein [Alicyclobacillus sacchari]TDY50126.1 glycosyltransferase involved in cell wall biosynthesis [Alicyclobacillus sacchari]GMA57506.1 glycosyl transferase family A [Alicyclobacillus sacchari]